ncbi:spore coat protein U domain-containing protein [Persephonella sp.]
MKKLVALALAGAVMSTAAFAGTDTEDFTITVNVLEKCEIKSVDDVTINDYDPISGNSQTGSSNVKFRCVKGSTWELSVPNTASLNHQDPNIGDTLTVNIEFDNQTSSDATSSKVDGTDSAGINGENIEPMTITVPGGQDVHHGTYTGTVTVTLSW